MAGARHQDTPRTDACSAQLGRVSGLPVAADVAVLGADDDQHEVLVADADDLARRPRLDVAEPSWPELSRLAGQAKPSPAPVDEIELVLFFVEVRPRLDAGREHPGIGPERGDLELLPNLPDRAVAELLQRRKRVTHGR